MRRGRTRTWRIVLAALPALAGAQVPDGFETIFNGRNLAGWHMSLTNHHGDTNEWRVFGSALVGQQDRPGNAGILLTDETFLDFEISLQIRPDFSCAGGVFLRSNSSGQACRVMLDYLPGGNIGGVSREGLKGLEATLSEGWEDAWNDDGWNVLRARIQGEVPRSEVWLNGKRIVAFQDIENRLPGGAEGGSVAVQVHGGDRCKLGLEHRFRRVAVRDLSGEESADR